MNDNQNLDMNDPKVQQIMAMCINYFNNNNMNMNNMNNNMNMNNMNNNMNMNNMNNINMNNIYNMYMNNMNNMNMNNMNNMNMNNMNMNGMNMNNMNFMNNNMNMNGMNMNNMNFMNNNNMNNMLMQNFFMNMMGNNNMNFGNMANNNFQNNFNQGNVNLNNNYNPGSVNLNNNNSNNNQEPTPIIPRGIKVVQDNNNYQQNPQMKNIAFDASSGLKVIITVPKETTYKELIKKYVNKIGISESFIGKEIIFLFNGEKMNTDSDDLIINFPNLAVITVVDQNNIIGAH